eukprot:2843217-Pleurochrysis_carterae.AAC.1
MVLSQRAAQATRVHVRPRHSARRRPATADGNRPNLFSLYQVAGGAHAVAAEMDALRARGWYVGGRGAVPALPASPIRICPRGAVPRKDPPPTRRRRKGLAAAGHDHGGHGRASRLAQQVLGQEAGPAAVGLLNQREQTDTGGRRAQPHRPRAAGPYAPRGHAGDPVRLQIFLSPVFVRATQRMENGARSSGDGRAWRRERERRVGASRAGHGHGMDARQRHSAGRRQLPDADAAPPGRR